jgi:hypothetical protein
VFRTELDYPRLVAYVAWFDHTRTAIGYYPGRYEPPNAAVRGPMMVPDDQRWRLLATFNGGFTYVDGDNGSTVSGRVNEPLKDGNATLVGYRDGQINILNWSGGANAGPDVAWARQSLAPIVWNGQLNPELNVNPNSPQWGFTLGGVTRVWRTGVGVDRRGNLIFVVGPSGGRRATSEHHERGIVTRRVERFAERFGRLIGSVRQCLRTGRPSPTRSGARRATRCTRTPRSSASWPWRLRHPSRSCSTRRCV